MLLTGRLVASARELVGLSQLQLAQVAGVGKNTVSRWERGEVVPHAETVNRVREALERRGIEFTNGGEPGVKLRPSKAVIPVP